MYFEIAVEFDRDSRRIRLFDVQQADTEDGIDYSAAENKADGEVLSSTITTTSQHPIKAREEQDRGIIPKYQESFTRAEFLSLFTQEERIEVREKRATNVAIEDFFGLLEAANEVRIDWQPVIDGVNYLKSQGILTSERASTILSGRIN